MEDAPDRDRAFVGRWVAERDAGLRDRPFSGDIERFVYSRYGNPTVATFQERLRLIEGAEACFATATGMAAVSPRSGALLGRATGWSRPAACSAPAS